MVPMMSNSSGQEKEKSENQRVKPSLREKYKEFDSLIAFLDREKKENLKYKLASRLHLEKLIEKYWERRLAEEENESGDDQQEEEGQQESLTELRLRILQHPCLTKSPLLQRWPVLVDSSSHSEWSLGDEVMAILSREKRAEKKANEEKQNTDLTEDQDQQIPVDTNGPNETEAHITSSIDELEDDIPLSLTLPIVSSCQSYLHLLLLLIANRISIGGKSGQKRLNRKDIITWRDVLESIKLIPTIPQSVLHSTEIRLLSLTGSSELPPNAALMANLGGKRCTLTQMIKNEVSSGFIPRTEKYQIHTNLSRKRKRFQQSLNRLDDDSFSRSNCQFSLNHLQSPPIAISRFSVER